MNWWFNRPSIGECRVSQWGLVRSGFAARGETMIYGGENTKRQPWSLARLVTMIGEIVGLLNKGSASAPAATGGQ
jgi:hypothetical protein